MKRKEVSSLNRYCLLLCASIIFVFAGFQTVIAQEDLPTKVPSVASPKSETTAQTRQSSSLPSKKYGLRADFSETVYALPAIDISKIEKKAANQIGFNRTMDASMKTYGKRYANVDGSEIRVLSIKSPGALGIRVHFEDFDIPEGNEVYIYGVASDSQVTGPYTQKGPWGNKEFWSSTVDGDTAIIEYYAKVEGGDFRFSEISHIYESPYDLISPYVLSCEVDASCYSNSEKNTVGRIVFVTNNGSFVCSGTLLNDRNSTFTPYFLTANHCVSSQSEAQTVETYWFYQTTACNSGVLKGGISHSVSGSNLLVTTQTGDSTLLRILGTMPGGLWFSGWDPNPKSIGTLAFGFHHPGSGTPPSTTSYLRRSDGSIASDTSSCSATGLTSAYKVNWTSGLTEPGSSGSGLWYSTQASGYLIGVLSCGPTNLDCNYNGNTYAIYGKFSNFYPLIKSYIDPSQTSSAQITSPANGSTFGSGTVTFNWSPSTGASPYYLFVGNSFQTYDIYSDYVTGGSTTVSGIPTDGRLIYVTMWSTIGGVWQPVNYSYRAFTGATATTAKITSPANGATFGSGTVTFNWSPSTGASPYYLFVGNSFQTYDIYSAYVTGGTTTVSGIPTDGRLIYVSMWSTIGGVWQPVDYSYRARSGVASVVPMSRDLWASFFIPIPLSQDGLRSIDWRP